MQAAGVFEDHKSPSDPLSGSSSPHLFRPHVPNPGPSTSSSTGPRPRSSSVTSNTSNQSHVRSLSIASLESPRNSIISIDDGFRMATRNNSTTSLTSLSGHPPPPSKDKYPSLSKLRGALAVFSDEEDEIMRTPKLSRSNSSSKPTATSTPGGVKKDRLVLKEYRFKFKDILKHKPPSIDPRSGEIKLVSSPVLLDPEPSPLSLSADEDFDKAIDLSRVKKKNITPKHPLNTKKNKIFSKDVRLEFNNGRPDFRTKFIKPMEDTTKEEKTPITSLRQQNQLLNQINRRWNKDKDKLNDVNDNNDKCFQSRLLKRRYLSDNDLTDDTDVDC